MKIAVVPQARATLGGKVFEMPEEYDPTIPTGVDRAFYHYLKRIAESQDHSMCTIDQTSIRESDIIFFIGFREWFHYYHKALKEDNRPYLVFFAREPPVYTSQHTQKNLIKLCSHFDLILTWMDELSGISSIQTFNWPVSPRQLSVEHRSDELPFRKRKLLTNVSSRTASTHPEELYSERERVIEFYEEHHPDKFTLYGRSWNTEITPADICKGLFQTPEFDVYQGEISSKTDAYAKHKFALAFENMTGIDGWISEKIFDVFASGRVPVYWGASNINEYLPEDTFIDYREFGHPDELHSFLSAMTESEYKEYLNAIEEYLSEGAMEFRADSVAEDVFGYISSLTTTSAKQIRDPEFVKQLEERYRAEDVTYARTASATVDALLAPPENLSRVEIGAKVLRAGYNHWK